MKVQIFWKNSDTQDLFQIVNECIEDLWLSHFIESEIITEENIKNELSINQEPALIIEESDIDFRDVIFEGIVPKKEEITQMFISIIWWESWSCSTKEWWCEPGGCGSCSSAQ